MLVEDEVIVGVVEVVVVGVVVEVVGGCVDSVVVGEYVVVSVAPMDAIDLEFGF